MAWRTAFVLMLTAAAGACGDNRAAPPDAGPPVDAAPAHATALIVASAGSASGVLAALDDTSFAMSPDLGAAGAIGGDPVIRHAGHELLVVNRGAGASVAILDDQTHALIEQLATGAASDPQDVAVVGSKLYVPVAGRGLAVLTRGSQAIATVDLSAGDPDGDPDCMSAFAVGTDVYVACGLLDDTQASRPPRGPGEVYVIDSITDHVRASFALTTAGPIGLLEDVGDGTIALSTLTRADGSGCVERITPGAAPSSQCTVRNLLLGGYVTRMQFQPLEGSTFIWMATTQTGVAQPLLQLMAYDFTSDELWPTISTPGEQIGDVSLCPDGNLVLSDVTAAPGGMRVYQLAEEITTAPVAIGVLPAAPHGVVCY